MGLGQSYLYLPNQSKVDVLNSRMKLNNAHYYSVLHDYKLIVKNCIKIPILTPEDQILIDQIKTIEGLQLFSNLHYDEKVKFPSTTAFYIRK